MDNVAALHDANVGLAEELRENEELVNEARGVKRKLKATEKELTEKKETLETVRAEKKSFYNDKRYHQQTAADLRKQIAEMGDVDRLRADYESLWEEFDQMRQDYDNLRAEIEEKNVEIEKLKDAKLIVIETRDSRGDYIPAFRHAVYKVLNANTPQNGVEDVFRAVLAFAGKELSDFPSPQIVRNMGIERLDVGQQHITVRT